MDLSSQYNPKEVEDRIYRLWEESGFFNPDKLPDAKKKKPFCIIMPPANANGDLHAGHALVLTIEDVITRYRRMRGFKTLWLPGLDHAGFETQVVYEKKLEKEGRSRFKMDPQELYSEIWDFTQNNKKNIETQTRKIGASCDWSREKFTLDKDIVETVYGTFEKLYRDGLVYRGSKIINWCSRHQTSLSDLETKDEEKTDKFYYLKYGPFVIATARPETKFGDKYVVMHPRDKRYKDYKDRQKIDLEWINGKITATVIKDKAIDMDFGTGVMTITPWHDPADFEIAERHNLQKEQIIDFTGKLLPIAGEFAGLKIAEARPKIIEKLKAKGLVEKIEENYKHTVKVCYKCGTLIEPQIKEQWFLKMKPLAEPAIKAVETNKIKFIPQYYKKIILHWLKNILDWPLSRQIAWGIPIPVWYKGDEIFVGRTPPEKEGWVKEKDTFDTWFSSGQWPFAVLKSKKGDFEQFYPTDVMETAGEIIFFWVARMIMLGLYATKKIPFKNVYLHGLVLDAKGQKMSKSKGNVINPLQITAEYGTDALRIALLAGNTPGTSLSLDTNKIKGYRNFTTKIWNASRFVLMNLNDYKPAAKTKLAAKDKKILADFKKKARQIAKLMDQYRFYSASEEAYGYFWHVFCDKIIEESKARLDSKDRASAQTMLLETLLGCLKILHPFMPFVTEEIYQMLPLKQKKKFLMIEDYPS